MADKAKNLRKTLSKNRLTKQQSNSENQPKMTHLKIRLLTLSDSQVR